MFASLNISNILLDMGASFIVISDLQAHAIVHTARGSGQGGSGMRKVMIRAVAVAYPAIAVVTAQGRSSTSPTASPTSSPRPLENQRSAPFKNEYQLLNEQASKARFNDPREVRALTDRVFDHFSVVPVPRPSSLRTRVDGLCRRGLSREVLVRHRSSRCQLPESPAVVLSTLDLDRSTHAPRCLHDSGVLVC
jgi:hypothetical protein